VPAPQAVVEWLKSFIEEFYKVDLKRPKRPESFKSLSDRFGNPVSITTERKSRHE
jgi:hypothetical protein